MSSMKEDNKELSWMERFSTISIRRADAARLKKLALPRKDRTPYDRKFEHKYEVITHALDALERERIEEETDTEDQRKVLGA